MLTQRSHDLLAGQAQISGETGMGTSQTVTWLAGGNQQESVHQRNLEINQKSAVKEQAGLPPPLRIPGKLAIVGNEVGMPLNEHRRRNSTFPSPCDAVA